MALSVLAAIAGECAHHETGHITGTVGGLGESNQQSNTENSETLEKVSVSTTFAQSWPVSVSTPFEFLGLEESRSRQLSKYPVSKSLGLDIFCFLSLADSLSICHM